MPTISFLKGGRSIHLNTADNWLRAIQLGDLEADHMVDVDRGGGAQRIRAGDIPELRGLFPQGPETPPDEPAGPAAPGAIPGPVAPPPAPPLPGPPALAPHPSPTPPPPQPMADSGQARSPGAAPPPKAGPPPGPRKLLPVSGAFAAVAVIVLIAILMARKPPPEPTPSDMAPGPAPAKPEGGPAGGPPPGGNSVGVQPGQYQYQPAPVSPGGAAEPPIKPLPDAAPDRSPAPNPLQVQPPPLPRRSAPAPPVPFAPSQPPATPPPMASTPPPRFEPSDQLDLPSPSEAPPNEDAVIPSAAADTIRVSACNQSNDTLVIAAIHMPVGERILWRSSGHWRIDPGQCRALFNTENHVYYLHAERVVGSDIIPKPPGVGEQKLCLTEGKSYSFNLPGLVLRCPDGAEMSHFIMVRADHNARASTYTFH